jgi:hypothetical protein
VKTFSLRTIAVASTLLGIPENGAGQESRLSNLALRGTTGDGGVLVAGFNLGPGLETTVLVRAIGPTLGQFGIPNPLLDPKLELYDGNGRSATGSVRELLVHFSRDQGSLWAAICDSRTPVARALRMAFY